MMERVIITGAGGFIGSELTRKLIENGVSVIAISRSFSAFFPDSPLIAKIEMDISDPQKLLESIPECEYDAFYHLAWDGVNGPLKSNLSVQLNNINMTANCAYVAKHLGCKKFLCAGTVAEEAIKSIPNLKETKGGMLYGAAKYCARILTETYCKNINQPYIWMQFSNIYGPHNKTGNIVSYTLGKILNEQIASFGPALQPYDFVFVDDLIEAVYRLGFCKTKKNFYFIGSGKPRVLKEYLTIIGKVCGRPDLICIGINPDDGIKYNIKMFDNTVLRKDVGEYVSNDFEGSIEYTVKCLQRRAE